MKYNIEYSKNFVKKFRKLDKSVQKILLYFLDNKLKASDNLSELGKELKGNLSGLWRFRVNDYRLIAEVVEDKLILIFIDLGHRKDIYK